MFPCWNCIWHFFLFFNCTIFLPFKSTIHLTWALKVFHSYLVIILLCNYALTLLCVMLCTLVSVSQSIQSLSHVWLCDPLNSSTPGLLVHHQLLEFTQTQVHCVSDAFQPSHPLSSPSPPAPNPSQHQSLFQWVISSHKVFKVLEFQL